MENSREKEYLDNSLMISKYYDNLYKEEVKKLNLLSEKIHSLDDSKYDSYRILQKYSEEIEECEKNILYIQDNLHGEVMEESKIYKELLYNERKINFFDTVKDIIYSKKYQDNSKLMGYFDRYILLYNDRLVKKHNIILYIRMKFIENKAKNLLNKLEYGTNNS